MPFATSTSRSVRSTIFAVALVIAVAALQVLPSIASAAWVVEPTPPSGSQLTVNWTSANPGESAVCWYETQPATSSAPNLAADSCVQNTSAGLGTRHSRTVTGLAAGTYWYRAVTRNYGTGTLEYNAVPVQFEVTSGRTVSLDGLRSDGTTITAATADPGGNRAYIAGDFKHVARTSGPGVLPDVADPSRTVTGSPIIANSSGTAATVTASTSDGAGGWFIAGNFDSIGGKSVNGLARILPDGGLDTSFSGEAISGGAAKVNALAFDPGSTSPARAAKLYVGGNFTKYGSISSPHLVALTTTGALLPGWAPPEAFAKPVNALLLDPRSGNDGELFVGGDFAQSFGGGSYYSHLVKLDATGALTTVAWSPAPSIPQHFVIAKIGAYDTGQTHWINDQGTATVNALAMVKYGISDYRLVVGGKFTRISHTAFNDTSSLDNPITANNLAFVHPDFGTRDTSDGTSSAPSPGDASSGLPGVTGSGAVVTALLAEGADVIVGGTFTSAYNSSVRNVARLTMTGLGTDPGTFHRDVNFVSPITNGSVTSLAKMTNGANADLVIGGDFDALVPSPSRAAHNVVIVDRASGQPNASKPGGFGVNLPVATVSTSPSGTVFIGGSFSTYDGVRSSGIAAITVAGDGRLRMDPAFALTEANAPLGEVRSMSSDGTYLVVGGQFGQIGGVVRTNLGKLSAATGEVTPLSSFTAATAGGTVNTVLMAGGKIWVGGAFNTINNAYTNQAPAPNCSSASCKNLVALNGDGSIPNSHFAGADGDVATLTASATAVYAGGSFSQVGGVSRGGLAAFDLTGALSDPLPSALPGVKSLLVDGGALWVGGIASINSSSVRRLARINLATSTVDPLGTNSKRFGLDTSEPAGSLKVLAAGGVAGRMYVGGSFANYGSQRASDAQASIALVSQRTGHLISRFNPQPRLGGARATVNALVTIGSGAHSRVIAGGTFDTFDASANRGGLAIAAPPTDVREPALTTTFATTPGTNVKVAMDGTSIIRKRAGAGFTVQPRAYDTYVRSNTSSSGTSGLARVANAPLPGASWQFGSVAPFASVASDFTTGAGVVRTCTTGGSGVADTIDLSADELNSDIAAAGGTVTCTWSGVMHLPEDAPGVVKFVASGGASFAADIKPVGSAIATHVTGDGFASAPLAWTPGTAATVAAEWSGPASGIDAVHLDWLLGAATATTVPAAAFTQASPPLSTYSLANASTADTPVVPLSFDFRATDADGNASPVATHKVALDGTAPSGDVLTTNVSSSATSTTASSISFSLATGSDGAGQYVAGVASRKIYVDFAPLHYPFLQLLGPSCDTASAVSHAWAAGDVTSSAAANSTTYPGIRTFQFAAAADGAGQGCYRFRFEATDAVGNTTAPKYADNREWLMVNNSNLVVDLLGGVGGTVGGVLEGVGTVVGSVGAQGEGASRIRVEIRRPDTTIAATPCDSSNPSTPYRTVNGPDFPTDPDADVNGDGQPDHFLVIDNGDGTYKVRCIYDTSAAGLGLPDGPYQLVTIITGTSSGDVPSDPVDFAVDNNKPVTSLTATGTAFAHASTPNTVWIDPRQPATFDLDVAADDDHDANGNPIGTGTGGIRATFDTGPAWLLPGANPGENVDATPTIDPSNPSIDRFSASYQWLPVSASAVPGTPTAMKAVVQDAVSPGHDVDVPFTVHYDTAAPFASLSYAPGLVAAASGHPHITVTAVDTDSGIGSVKVHRIGVPTIPPTATKPATCPAVGDPAWSGAVPVEFDRSANLGAPSFDDVTVVPGTCYRYTVETVDNVGIASGTYDPTLLSPTMVVRTDQVGVTITRDIANAPEASVEEDLPDYGDVIHVQLNAVPAAGTVAVTISDPALVGTAPDPAKQQVTLQQGSGPRAGTTTLLFDAATKTIDLRIYAVNDRWDEDDQHVVELVFSSTHPSFASLAATTYKVHIKDNDTSATIAAPAAPIALNEGSADVGIQQIGLTSKPYFPVTAEVVMPEGFVGTVDSADPSATFTTTFAGDDPTRTLRIVPVSDNVVRAHPQRAVTVRLLSTSDSRYANAVFAPIPVQLIDKDARGAAIVVAAADPAKEKSGVLQITEGDDATTLNVTANVAAGADIVIKPVVKSGLGLEVSPEQQSIPAGSTKLQVQFSVSAADDADDEGDAYDGIIGWSVTSAESTYKPVVADTKVRIRDNDSAPARTPRETNPLPVEPAPRTPPAPPKVTPPVRPRAAMPVPVLPASAQPQVQQPILPMAQPAAGAPRPQRTSVPAEPAASGGGIGGWAKEHKGALTVSGAALAAGGAVAAKTGMLAALKGLVGGLDHLLDKIDPRNLNRKNRERIKRLRDKAKRLRGDRERPLGRKRRRSGDEDILDELEHKYDADYEDPLDAFERGPKPGGADVLRDVETRLRGFDIDDAA